MSHSDEIGKRMAAMESVIAEQETAIHHVFAMVQAIARGDEENSAREDRSPMRDDVWTCTNCAARLGLYNQEREEMRVRYKDLLVYIKPGKGGILRIPCRRCGEENVLTDTR